MIRINDYGLEETFYYATYHTWAKPEQGLVKIGITDFMQKHVGKIVFFLARPIGTRVEQGKPIGTIETAKWVGPIKSPVTGVISAINEEAKRNPAIVHEDPYGKGWLIVIKPEKFEEEVKQLLYGDKAIDWYRGDIEKYRETGELPKV